MSLVAARPRVFPPSLAAFLVAVVGLGVGSAAVSFGSGNPANGAGLTYPPVWPPDPVFWAVWLVIYPCSAVAAWLVWQRRHEADVRGALVAFALINVAAALFLPISGLVGGLPAVLTLMDLNGMLGVYVLAWLFSRYSTRAALWLLPYLIWMQ
jgi:tryptophan-rich sensory protein